MDVHDSVSRSFVRLQIMGVHNRRRLADAAVHRLAELATHSSRRCPRRPISQEVRWKSLAVRAHHARSGRTHALLSDHPFTGMERYAGACRLRQNKARRKAGLWISHSGPDHRQIMGVHNQRSAGGGIVDVHDCRRTIAPHDCSLPLRRFVLGPSLQVRNPKFSHFRNACLYSRSD